MLYYRYRAGDAIHLKELLYDELYFSSTEECNDPFDSTTYVEFPNDKDAWKNLLKVAFNNNQAIDPLLEIVADTISPLCPKNYSHVMLELTKAMPEPAISLLRSFMDRYQPEKRYFTSFSKSENESLMWSHYANKHQGYCLIFKSIDGRLKQCSTRRKDSFRTQVTGSLGESMSYGFPDDFLFQDVEYVDQVTKLNAFNYFPEAVAGKGQSKEEIDEIREARDRQYRQKHRSWSYEQEARIMLTTPIPWLFGGHFNYSVQQRLFHFEHTQLVGIIFGARIKDHDKAQLMEIIDERARLRIQSLQYQSIIMDFMIFESKLATDHRKVEIVPSSIQSLGKLTTKNENGFDRMYSKWIEKSVQPVQPRIKIP